MRLHFLIIKNIKAKRSDKQQTGKGGNIATIGLRIGIDI